jgi:SAM-dependent methyltransferase
VRRCLRCESVFEAGGWRCPACGYQPGNGAVLRFVDDREAQDFPESSFAALAALEDRSFWFRARNTVVLTVIRRHFPDLTSFFELGCGTGYVLRAIRRAFPHAGLVGGELAHAGLEIAQARVPDATLIQVDGRHLPYREEFQLIGAFDMLEHVDDDLAVLAEISAALRPGGGVIVTVPQHPWLWGAADDFGEHKRRYTRTELVAKLRTSRLEVEYVTSFMMLVLPLMAASRLRRRDVDTFDPEEELRLPPRIDRTLERILGLERIAVKRGVSLPAGGSLLAVARRRI